ncbi:FAD-dependent oxidoreductase [Pelagicoccus sp. SDUM812002]|nr:FAD-dependent oxidoreductase [Pelagicoccus sp. SDUM812002]
MFGGGLAGTILAERFTANGQKVLLVDAPQHSRCSRVAAGLINPIGGKRLKLVWQADILIPHAKAYYQQLEQQHATSLFHPRAIHRYFSNQQEAQIWQKRKGDPDHQRWVGFSDDTHFTIPNAGYLDTKALLELLQAQLAQQDSLLSSTFNYDKVHLTEKGLAFRDYTADFAIFAEGHLATRNPHFQFVPYKPAKGIIATIKLHSPPETHPSEPSRPIILKSKFIVPRHDGSIQVGATYNWDDPTDTPDHAGIQELKQFLDAELGTDTWQFDDIQAGVRPATAGAYPVVGPHPEHPHLIAFNGFGSKGSLQIPYFADALIKSLSQRSTIPLEVLPSRFIRKPASKAKRWIATNVVKETILGNLRPGDTAIDATAGNGHDTQWLAEKVGPSGHVFAYDIQEQAISATYQRLAKQNLLLQTTLLKAGHETLLETVPALHRGQIAAIVFNLGFLPGADTRLITQASTTLTALRASLEILKPAGILSVTLYPTHSGAQQEVDQVLEWFHALPEDSYQKCIVEHPQNNPSSPYPLFVKKHKENKT